jgi:PhnB protein
MVDKRPPDYHSITPYLLVDGADRFAAWCVEAFGADRRAQMEGPDGKVGHGEIQIGDSVIMYADVNEETSPSSVGLMLYVDDVDAAFAQAIAAGATSEEEPSDKFYGDRMGTVGDPFGNWWSIGTHVEDVSMEEMERRMAAEFGASGGGS